eukprot:gene29240-29653_t
MPLPGLTAQELMMGRVRREDKGAHSAQVSFPGGRYEMADGELLFTALREAEEE